MKNKILLAVVVLLSIVTFIVIKTDNTKKISENPKITIKTEENNIEQLNLEDYLVGVLAAEMPALFETEALKAQAVAARSYALYKINHSTENYDVLTNVTNQSYITVEDMHKKWQDDFNTYYSKILNAVQTTKNEVLLYNKEIIEAFYFSMSNGKTEEARTVFQEDLPYIKSVDSSFETSLSNFQVSTTFQKQEFCEKLKLNCLNDLKIEILERSSSGRINKIKINNQEFLGTAIREKLSLRSTDFTIKQNNEEIIITTKGYGHGVGMSQYGANELAKKGYTYQDILKYYYQDIEIKKMV